MNPVMILQTSIVTAMGDTLSDTWEKLCNGNGAVAAVNRFPVNKPGYHQAACISDLDTADEGKTIWLIKKLLPQLSPPADDTFLIWTGIKGGVENIERIAEGSFPTEYQYAADYRQYVRGHFKLSPNGMDINAACAASTVGVCIGADMIGRGEAESVLVIGADWVSRFTFLGFGALNALTKTACRPFDKKRDGLALGDGAAGIHLVSEHYLEKTGSRPLAQLTGWGISNDALHITRPDLSGNGLISAVNTALTTAELSPGDIGAFCAHGTGTVYNDTMELAAVSNVFGERKFPLFSVKGALGHTLGAAGAIETAISIKALKAGKVPPTYNCSHPEDAARARVANGCQPLSSDIIMTSNSGFGGINAALILKDMP